MNTPTKLAASAFLILILLLAAVLRFCCLDAQSLWNDEGTSVTVAQRDPMTIARNAAADIHPPLYYWALSGWVRMHGTSEPAVRSLSALLGVVLVALTYALGSWRLSWAPLVPSRSTTPRKPGCTCWSQCWLPGPC
jgi:mannosyltransferase